MLQICGPRSHFKEDLLPPNARSAALRQLLSVYSGLPQLSRDLPYPRSCLSGTPNSQWRGKAGVKFWPLWPTLGQFLWVRNVPEIPWVGWSFVRPAWHLSFSLCPVFLPFPPFPQIRILNKFSAGLPSTDINISTWRTNLWKLVLQKSSPKEQVVRWDFKTRSLTTWLAMRIESLAMDGAGKVVVQFLLVTN